MENVRKVVERETVLLIFTSSDIENPSGLALVCYAIFISPKRKGPRILIKNAKLFWTGLILPADKLYKINPTYSDFIWHTAGMIIAAKVDLETRSGTATISIDSADDNRKFTFEEISAFK